MEAIKLIASWDEKNERMIVILGVKEDQYVEKFTKEQWNSFILTIDTEPIRLGGLEIKLKGQSSIVQNARAGIISYLKKIDEAFKVTGKTDFLRG